MSVPVALTHRTVHCEDRPVGLGRLTIRRRPAQHCQAPILAFSLPVEPKPASSTGCWTCKKTSSPVSSYPNAAAVSSERSTSSPTWRPATRSTSSSRSSSVPSRSRRTGELSLVQELFLTVTIAAFWHKPTSFVSPIGGTGLHDELMLPELGACSDARASPRPCPVACARRGGVYRRDGSLRRFVTGTGLGETVRLAGGAVRACLQGCRCAAFPCGHQRKLCRRPALYGLPAAFGSAWQHRRAGATAVRRFGSSTGQSVGCCADHVAHPAGRAEQTFPLNANKVQARRRSRFFPFGCTSGRDGPAAPQP